MRRLALVLTLAISAATLFAAPPASADGDCGTPNGGALDLIGRYQTDTGTPAGVVGTAPVNTGDAGCSMLVYTSDGEDVYGLDTRILPPGTNAVLAYYFNYTEELKPTDACFGGDFGGCYPLTEKPSPTGGRSSYASKWIPLPGYPGAFSGRIVACASDACTVFESADKYQCDELFVHERNSDVSVDNRPCTKLP